VSDHPAKADDRRERPDPADDLVSTKHVLRVRRGELRVGLVGNKLRPWTNASQQSIELLKQWPYPLVAQLRDSQAYVVLTGLGKSLFDYHSAQVREHQDDWQPLLKWLKKA